MKNRDALLIELRGEKIGVVAAETSFDEYFQNEILRPILKLQNELLLITFINYTKNNKIDFNSLSSEKKIAVIENSIQKDSKFRNTLKGMIVGLFTLEEYQKYIQNSSSLNRRIMGMLMERLKSQCQLLTEKI